VARAAQVAGRLVRRLRFALRQVTAEKGVLRSWQALARGMLVARSWRTLTSGLTEEIAL